MYQVGTPTLTASAEICQDTPSPKGSIFTEISSLGSAMPNRKTQALEGVRMRFVMIALLSASLVGCSTAEIRAKRNSVTVGMPRAEFIKLMGPPASITGRQSGEGLFYDGQGFSDLGGFCAVIANDKVYSFGEMYSAQFCMPSF